MARAPGGETRLGDTLSRWVVGVSRRPGRVVAFFALATVASLAYAAGNLGIQTDQETLFNQELPFRQAETRYRAAFPKNFDNLFVVVDGATAEQAGQGARALATRLAGDDENFASVFLRGGGAFFEQHAFLYLDTDALESLADRLAEAQPYLAALARERSIRNLASLLARGVRAPGLC